MKPGLSEISRYWLADCKHILATEYRKSFFGVLPAFLICPFIIKAFFPIVEIPIDFVGNLRNPGLRISTGS